MPFKFNHVCDLLSKIERWKTREPPLLQKELDLEIRRVIEYWFREHRHEIDDPGTDGVALLSTLFPEKRTDRVYGFQEMRLTPIIARCLYLNSHRTKILHGWKTAGNGDLGTCVERALREFDCEPNPGAAVTVEEVDHALQQLASKCRFSGADIRSTATVSTRLAVLEPIYLRLKSSEAKWFTRLLLKDFSPVILPVRLALESYHFLLPDLLRFQNNFSAAVLMLRGPLSCYHANPDATSRRLFKKEALQLLSPQVGVKVGVPPFFKARSIAHCAGMTGNSKWSVERKYDGEYCEVHIDLSKGPECIRIFSKSGKDSTKDRQALHQTLLDAFRIGNSDCAFKSRCIAVGELVVYSDVEERILEFHQIRKHVLRSGFFLGTDQDSPAPDHEHLMIILFDILLIDDDIMMGKGYMDRRAALRKVVKKRQGYAMTSEKKIVDFASDGAMEILRYEFAASLAYRTEGLVLKPIDEPYFSFDTSEDSKDGTYFIKLKKDYIQELGQERDIADFAIVGASYDSGQATKSGLKNLHFTHFHLGCVINTEEVRMGHKPVFEVVAFIGEEKCIPNSEIQALNQYGRFRGKAFERSGNVLQNLENFQLSLDQTPASQMSAIFTEPCVVEVVGSGFEKPSNKSYFMLRHPRILKLHLDRSWKDAVAMHELQSMAERARNAHVDGESQEMMLWIEKLKGKVERSAGRKRILSTTPRTESTVSPGSLQKIQMTPSGNPTDLSPSRRSRNSPPVFVRADPVEQLTIHEPKTGGDGHHRMPLSQSSHNRLQAPVSPPKHEAKGKERVDVQSTMQLSVSAIRLKRKRSTDDQLGGAPPLAKRRRTENQGSFDLNSAKALLKRCPSCGKYKRPERSSGEPLMETTSQPVQSVGC